MLSPPLISFYIFYTLFIDICLSSYNSFGPSQASALLSFTYWSYVSPTYHHSSIIITLLFPALFKDSPKMTATKYIYFCLETKD